jgi:ABC-type uncharacterized transport system permease subunit
MWPIEGAPKALQIVGTILPFAVPVKTFARILAGGLPLSDQRFLVSCGIIITWCLAQLFLSFWLVGEENIKKSKKKEI